MREGFLSTREATGAITPHAVAEAPTPGPVQNPFERPIAAIRRYAWLIVTITIVCGGLGALATRFITPEYEVRATLWVATGSTGGSERVGPIRSAELLSSNAWIELFRSYRVVDEVVRRLAMYVAPQDAGDAPLFASFSLKDRFLPGQYELVIDRTGKTWSLSNLAGGPPNRGSYTDSVGAAVGFSWALPEGAYAGSGERRVRFTVIPPREKSLELLQRVGNRMQERSNFLWLTFSDSDGGSAQRVLNAWVDEFVRVAAELKKQNIVEFAKILQEQLKFAENATQQAEAAYQNFRVNTIILPTEAGPVAARGLENDRDPAMASFFEQKIEYDNLRNDREALEKVIANAATGRTPYEGLLFIPSVAQSPGAEALREAFRRLYALQSDLRAKQQAFTDQHPAVIETNAAIEALRRQTIPQLASGLLLQLRERESDYQRRIAAASRELREIPPRTIEERRLSRAVAVSEALYTNLKGRFAEAQLAEASATPDVSVLDTAIAPLTPSKNTAMMVLLGSIIISLGVAVLLALLLDQLDGRLRYTNQVTSELGLVVAGAVPRIPKGGIDSRSPDQVTQFLESFRTIRMHVIHAEPASRVTLAVTSAAPGDGKSLVSANLALSCAEAGLKTVLVDGDTRRGSLHRLHGLSCDPGLTEYLAGLCSEQEIVQVTPHPNLRFVSCGKRHPRSPELLASQPLRILVEKLSETHDVVIVDTPPLAAGIDAYAISAATGRVLLVLRMGQTMRRLASAKLDTLDRLPVQVVGAVLNAVPLTGEFQYYAYSGGYGTPPDSAGQVLEISGSR